MVRTLKKPFVIAAALIEKNGKFLLTYSPVFKAWRLPAGRIEFKENLEDTLKREMEEELNLKIKKCKFLGYGQDYMYHYGFKRNSNRLLMIFHVKLSKNDKLENKTDEITEIKWLTLDEMRQHENMEDGLAEFFKNNPKLNI